MEYCLATANAFVRDGHSVLIYSPQRSSIDPVVRQFTSVKRQGFLSDIELQDRSDLAPALAIGREWLGSDHSVVKALEYGLGTHHGALPRPFQSAVEELLERKRLRVVVASPTLAQGVDLSCSVLLFRSLTRFDASTGRHQPIPAAEFANVVGRAGRAYVDLDGIVGVPCFDRDPAKRRSRHRQFNELIQASRDQSLVSGMVHLVFVLAGRLSAKLGVDFNSFFNYVINNASLWSDARLGEAEDLGDDAEDDPDLRTLDEHLGDLDLAILSLVDPLDVPTEDLPALLDAVLQRSLWERTLCNLDPAIRQLADPLLESRAVWLWKTTSAEQRRACFSAGLGTRAGLFIYSRLDELVSILVQWQAAVLLGDLAEIGRIATLFAKQVAHDSQFFVRKPPGQWQQVLVDWILGKAFREMLTGLGVREEQRTQSFVQDGAVFRLVWAAEAVRTQALSTGHARAGELGDGPMMTLTHGVPSISAALLCQAGFASRTGAWWAVSQLGADFTTIEGMRAWMLIHKPTLEDVDFWENADQHLLWMRLSLPDLAQSFSRWHRRTSAAEPSWWSDVPANGALVRLIPQGDQAALVCSDTLEPLGELDLDFNPEGAAIEAEVEM
ncbi:MAG TPA: hypothetical protein DDW98_14780, partial [Gammaproteobacteria bacterium]|nr:hypothetical protein [Gammaproteobacteria bacterium]